MRDGSPISPCATSVRFQRFFHGRCRTLSSTLGLLLEADSQLHYTSSCGIITPLGNICHQAYLHCWHLASSSPSLPHVEVSFQPLHISACCEAFQNRQHLVSFLVPP